jgi:hypothetical protein
MDVTEKHHRRSAQKLRGALVLKTRLENVLLLRARPEEKRLLEDVRASLRNSAALDGHHITLKEWRALEAEIQQKRAQHHQRR